MPPSKHWLGGFGTPLLNFSSVDTNIFAPHSVRHASTSKAARIGISLDIIRRSAGWSQNSQCFAKFYNRPLYKGYDFAKAVFLD